MQPLDLINNGAMKKMGNCTFTEFFTDCITTELLKDPGKDIITTDVDLKLSTFNMNIWNPRKEKHNITRLESSWHYKGH